MDMKEVKRIIDDAVEDICEECPKYGLGIAYLVADRLHRLAVELEGMPYLTDKSGTDMITQ